MTITIADGRGALWQWDTGRRVKITDGDGVKQIHYQNRCFGRSVDVDVGDDGTAIIPDELLQDWHTLTAYAYVTDDAGGYTKVQVDFAVHKRARPSDYAYTPTEHAGFDRLRAEIGDLSALQTDAKDTLVAAINEAAASGGSESMDLCVADGYIQYSTDGGSTWTNLIAVAELKGGKGDPGNKGDTGATGAPGKDGKDGTNGITPHIGDNGHWYLGENDTGKPSRGATGAKGDPGTPGTTGPAGAPGKDGHSPVVTATKSGKTTTISVDGAAIATVEDGADGAPGKDGADGSNGKDGKPGEKGADGAPGVYYGTTQPTGDTHPVWIDPDGGPDDGGLLPAVTADDNGKVLRVVSSAWSAEDMPTGGTDMGITGASVGQIAKITAVDESGVPTAWSPVDMPTVGGIHDVSWRAWDNVVVPEGGLNAFDFTTLASGEKLSDHQVKGMFIYSPSAVSSVGSEQTATLTVNGDYVFSLATFARATAGYLRLLLTVENGRLIVRYYKRDTDDRFDFPATTVAINKEDLHGFGDLIKASTTIIGYGKTLKLFNRIESVRIESSGQVAKDVEFDVQVLY